MASKKKKKGIPRDRDQDRDEKKRGEGKTRSFLQDYATWEANIIQNIIAAGRFDIPDILGILEVDPFIDTMVAVGGAAVTTVLDQTAFVVRRKVLAATATDAKTTKQKKKKTPLVGVQDNGSQTGALAQPAMAYAPPPAPGESQMSATVQTDGDPNGPDTDSSQTGSALGEMTFEEFVAESQIKFEKYIFEYVHRPQTGALAQPAPEDIIQDNRPQTGAYVRTPRRYKSGYQNADM